LAFNVWSEGDILKKTSASDFDFYKVMSVGFKLAGNFVSLIHATVELQTDPIYHAWHNTAINFASNKKLEWS